MLSSMGVAARNRIDWVALLAMSMYGPAGATAQTPAGANHATTPGAPDRNLEQQVTELRQEVAELKGLVVKLQEQLSNAATPAPAAAPGTTASQAPAGAVPAPAAAPAALLPAGVTINGTLDGYYEYNLNAPVGRVNQLRAYDVSSNSFNLNQADLIVERAADPAAGQRIGMRLDLQYGQATSTLQGNPANELRPEVYRNIFQAYGTYVFPWASGLTLDFGKWASSLGIEGNYTKDQVNYSRSFWFDFLPFYHAGLRARLAINDQLAVNLWVVNGTDQTEAFNNYKDQMVGLVFTPTSAVSWTVNFYRGQEHPDVLYLATQPATPANLPNQQGTYILPINNPPDGKLLIADTYATWQVTHALMVAAEADDVQERLYSYSSAQRVRGGALYASYQLTPTLAVAARAEYLEDLQGLFSGTAQYLKEGTLTFDYRLVDGFLVRGELRRDQSNRHYFYSPTLGVLESAQPTVTVGLVWWFGQKAGTW